MKDYNRQQAKDRVLLEKALVLLIIEVHYLNTLRSVRNFSKKEELWTAEFERHKDSPISVLEFGVFEGDSIENFAKLNSHKESEFFGFDSFRGIPEDGPVLQYSYSLFGPSFPLTKGIFNLDGIEPILDDERISLVKGWFQNTLPKFLSENKFTEKNLVVHFDADIYTATLFVMIELDKLKQPYLAIFDEFAGYEARALYDYCKMMGASVEFFGATWNSENQPDQISCKIIPKYEYFPSDEKCEII